MVGLGTQYAARPLLWKAGKARASQEATGSLTDMTHGVHWQTEKFAALLKWPLGSVKEGQAYMRQQKGHQAVQLGL